MLIDEFAGIDRLQQLAHFLAGQRRRLSARSDILGTAHRASRGEQQDAPGHQTIEQLTDRSQMLLEARTAISEPSSSMYAAIAIGSMSPARGGAPRAVRCLRPLEFVASLVPFGWHKPV